MQLTNSVRQPIPIKMGLINVIFTPMKKILVSLFFSIILLNSFAAHIKGGFLTYKYLGPGLTNPSFLRYKVTLTVYMVCNPSAGQLTNPINFTVFTGDGPTQFANPSVNLTGQYNLGKAYDEPCITGDQAGCYYTIVTYELNNYELPVNAEGYTISYQRCCRIAGMDNIQNSASTGNTYSIKIPGTSSPVPNANKNSSPDFAVNDTAVVCGGSFFSFSLAATDEDGDELRYSLCSAFDGGSTGNPTPNPSQSPPFNTVAYASPYSGSQPMGSRVTINPRTGLLSGIAPPITSNGEYVVTVCVSEYRNGIYLGESRKELHIRVRDCVPLKAELDPKPVTCDGFTVSFSNAIVNPSGTTYLWNFGDPGSGINNTSTATTDRHRYTDTGIYTVKLYVSLSGLCADSTTLEVKVYPGFFPAFNINPPFCKDIPVKFTDQTTSSYGVPTGWRWDFGDLAVTNDSSNNKNPSYTYTAAGVYDVKLIVGNTFGCVDSVFRQISIAENPLLTVLPKDTSYCNLDSLSLTATGTGNFNWTPATNIIGAGTANPIVFPTVPTTYFVNLNANGCVSRDSVKVNPVNNLSNSITASATNICEADTITLTGNSNYTNNITWAWSPIASVALPSAKITKAFPVTNTQYTLTTRWGKNCVVNTSTNIVVKPLAVPDAGPFTYICNGQGTAPLQATGGVTYQWLPATGLSNPNIANPLASPATTTTYSVKVGVAGCTALKSDTVTVLVRSLPQIKPTNDTLICSIDTLQLKTAVTGNFVWSPNYMINNVNSATPLVSPDLPTKYFVSVTDPFGCINNDSVFVDVKLYVTINAGKDTTICRTDTLQINTVSDALSYKWSPATFLNSDSAKRPLSSPNISQITYYVIGNIGKCQSRDTITIKTVPYPKANAGIDQRICFGDIAQLLATGGSSYSWTPSSFLSATNIPNPASIKPATDTRYFVSVTDTFGCPKIVIDDVWVRVRPQVQASTGIRDTSIVIGQSILLNATGGDRYNWTPSTGLNNPNISRPLAAPLDDIEYKLLVTILPEGCTGTDSVKIKVFKVPPNFYVPTAFSPNFDGLNDVLKPFALGMKSIKYFRVYNRLGNLIFETSQLGKGWDGTYKGNPQDPAAYVWMAEGETFKGEVIIKKGTAVLVR